MPKLVPIKPIPAGYAPIDPVVGRIVNFFPGKFDVMPHEKGKALAALIVRVLGPTTVNLTVFDHNGDTHARESIFLAQPGVEVNEDYVYCCWSLYQVERAAAEGK